MDKNIIEKSNVLNTMQKIEYDMTLNEFRLFCMFLSKLNARNPDIRSAVISIKDFEKLFDVEFNTRIFKKKIRKIASANVEIKEGDNIEIVQLYSKFAWVNKKTCDSITVTCNSDIVPYIFELRKNYTSYRLENISKLNSISKIRLYELMKQYEKLKEIVLEVDELQRMIYSIMSEFRFFNQKVLKPAIKDINEYTDITVKYEKVLECRKCVAIKFYIESKKKPVEVQEVKQIEVTEAVKASASEPEKKDLRDLYNKYFSKEQEEMFKAKIHTVLQSIYKTDDMLKTRTNAIYSKCLINFEMKQQTGTLKNPLAYMSGIITNAVSSEIDKPMKEKNRSYNLGDFEKLAINHKEIEEIEQSKSVEKEKCSCTQSNGAVSHSEIDRVITPVNEETAIQAKISNTDDAMQADADLCLKATELVKSAADYENAVKLLDMFMTGWRDFDGFFLDQINEALEKKNMY